MPYAPRTLFILMAGMLCFTLSVACDSNKTPAPTPKTVTKAPAVAPKAVEEKKPAAPKEAEKKATPSAEKKEDPAKTGEGEKAAPAATKVAVVKPPVPLEPLRYYKQSELQGGAVFSGSPKTSVKGSWKIILLEESVPKDAPEDIRKQMETIRNVVMTFDDSHITVSRPEGSAKVTYKVLEEQPITMIVEADVNGEKDRTEMTFLDNDHILIRSLLFPAQVGGIRIKK